MSPKLPRLYVATLTAAALLTSGCAMAQVAPPAPQIPSTASSLPDDPAFDGLLQAFDVPGMAIATLTGCNVDGVRTIGMADLHSGMPVTQNTAFEAASLSKPVFAYLVLQLADEGVIDLDAPIGPLDYPRIADRDTLAKLTPRMVLTHRTGLPNWAGDSLDEDRTDALSFEAAPGTQYSYSGEAFEILRAFVVQQTGLSLQQLFEQRLGAIMPNSSFDGRLRGEATGSKAYVAASAPDTVRPLNTQPHQTGAAWGLLTTAGDYAAFLSEVCRAQKLTPAMQTDMLRPQSPIPDSAGLGPSSYGLGWVVMELGSETIVMHSGNNDEYRSLAAYLPDTGAGYVVLTNGRNGEDLIMALLQQADQ